MSICPKNKSSKARRDKRRANWKMSAMNLVKCSKCGKEVFQRDDDKAETVKARLDVYQKQTEPLIGYYTSKGIIADIKVSTIEGTFEDVKKVLGK